LKPALILTVMLVIILAFMVPHTYSQDSNATYTGDDISIYLGMHTINFTQVLSKGVGLASGSMLNASPQSSKILEAIRNISMGCDTLSCIAANATARSSVEQSMRALESVGYIDPVTAYEIIGSLYQPFMSDEALRRILNSSEISQLISDASKESRPLNILGVLDSLFRGGRISLNEYIAALELLKRLSLEKGLQEDALVIDKMQFEVIKQLIISRTAEGLVRGLADILVSSNSSTQNVLPQQAGGASPLAYQAYPVYVLLPSGGLQGLDLQSIVIAIFATSALLVLAAAGIPDKISRLGSLIRGRPSSPRIAWAVQSGVIRIYWKAVEILSRRIPRGASETHREYLGKVRGRIPASQYRYFEDLTELYEKVRYAHESEEEYYERALRDYKGLVGR